MDSIERKDMLAQIQSKGRRNTQFYYVLLILGLVEALFGAVLYFGGYSTTIGVVVIIKADLVLILATYFQDRKTKFAIDAIPFKD